MPVFKINELKELVHDYYPVFSKYYERIEQRGLFGKQNVYLVFPTGQMNLSEMNKLSKALEKLGDFFSQEINYNQSTIEISPFLDEDSEYFSQLLKELPEIIREEKERKKQAFIQGAASDVLGDKVPPDIVKHVSSFLHGTEGANLARTRKSANTKARDEVDKLEKKLNK